MSDFSVEQQIVTAFVKANWDIVTNGPMVYPNHEEPQNNSGIFYSSVTIVPNEAARTRNSIGAPRLIRNRGFIFFTIYTPKGGGTLKANGVRDFLVNLFDEKVLLMPNGRRIVCGICSVQTLGLKDNLYRMTVSVPYHRDEWPGD